MRIIAPAIVLFILIFSFPAAGQDEKSPLNITFIASVEVDRDRGNTAGLSMVIQKAISFIDAPLEVSFVQMSLMRSWRLLGKRSNVCVYPRVKPQRLDDYGLYVSKPIAIFPSFRLIVKAEDKERFKDVTSVAKALEYQDIKLGYIVGAGYGEKIGGLIKRYPDRFFGLGNAAAMEATQTHLEKMVLSGRFDGYLGIPTSENAGPEKVAILPLTEANTVIPVYIVCSNSDEGREIVRLLEKVMDLPVYQQFLLQAHFMVFPPAEHERLRESFYSLIAPDARPFGEQSLAMPMKPVK